MTISPVGSPEPATAYDTTNLPINVPAGVQEGDLLVFVASSTTTVDSANEGATGFSHLVDQSGWASRTIEVWTRLAPASPPASYTFLMNNSFSTHTGTLRAYRRVKKDGPIDVYASTFESGADTDIVLPSITTTRRGAMLLAVVGGKGVTWTPPGSMTERWDFYNSTAEPTGQTGAEELLGAAGATGTRTFTSSAATEKGGVLIAIAAGRGAHVGFVGN